jgi:hypothetical protein
MKIPEWTWEGHDGSGKWTSGAESKLLLTDTAQIGSHSSQSRNPPRFCHLKSLKCNYSHTFPPKRIKFRGKKYSLVGLINTALWGWTLKSLDAQNGMSRDNGIADLCSSREQKTKFMWNRLNSNPNIGSFNSDFWYNLS